MSAVWSLSPGSGMFWKYMTASELFSAEAPLSCVPIRRLNGLKMASSATTITATEAGIRYLRVPIPGFRAGGGIVGAGGVMPDVVAYPARAYSRFFLSRLRSASMSSACWYRSPLSFARAFSTMRSRSGVTFSLNRATGCGSSLMSEYISAAWCSPRNGSLVVRSS